jgi:hypothetical protein
VGVHSLFSFNNTNGSAPQVGLTLGKDLKLLWHDLLWRPERFWHDIPVLDQRNFFASIARLMEPTAPIHIASLPWTQMVISTARLLGAQQCRAPFFA